MKGSHLAVISAFQILALGLPPGAAVAQEGRSSSACFDFVSRSRE